MFNIFIDFGAGKVISLGGGSENPYQKALFVHILYCNSARGLSFAPTGLKLGMYYRGVKLWRPSDFQLGVAQFAPGVGRESPIFNIFRTFSLIWSSIFIKLF
jgi:hypothetical protein